MGLDAKDIQQCLCKVVQVSTWSSYTFIKRHPLVSSVLLVCFILYIFLSYIYSFLVYLSPFLACAAIFVRIFWSSEQTQFKYVKIEEEKEENKIVEPKHPKIPNNGRRELYKYPSQNAISRRRNFREKKWDVYGGLEERAKNLSTAFHNEFTSRNTNTKEAKASEKGESSLDYGLFALKSQALERQTLRSEPSMRDLVDTYGTNEAQIEKEKMEDGDDEDEDEDEAQEDRNKVIEWTENDQKNLMDLGISELERNRRLEGLMARRLERKLFKLQIEKGITRNFEGIDGLEIPSSAPSIMPQSPFDIPYYPFEEKLKHTEDCFYQEYTCSQKDMSLCRNEGFNIGPYFPSDSIQEHGGGEPYSYYDNGRKYSDRPSPSRFRRLPGKGNHDKKIDQLIHNEDGESEFEFKAPNPVKEGEEKTHDDDDDGKMVKDNEKKSISYHSNEPSLATNISNVETTKVSETSISATTTNTDTINEDMHDTLPSPFSKRHENIFLTRGCHTPTYSIASDLHVEVSEVGSPTSTIDENAETNSSSDRDSVLYDGDIDRGVSSGSEDMWGASFHGRQSHGVVLDDNVEGSNSKAIATPMALRQIDEENIAAVSSMFSRSDIPEDSSNHAINGDHNIFGCMKYSMGQMEAPQSSISSYVSSPPKELINSSMDPLPNETLSERLQNVVVQGEWCTLSENIINDVDANNSATMEHDNSENSRSNEVPTTSVVRQESIDEASIYSIASSPRSVLPEKPIADEISSSNYDDQMHIGAQQYNMEDMAQETLNDEPPPDTLPQNIQPLMDATLDDSHNVGSHHPQDQTNSPENSMEESKNFGNINDAEVSNIEEQDKIKNGDSSKDNSPKLTRQEVTTQSATLVEKTTTEDMDQKSREIIDDKVPSIDLIDDDKNDKPTSSNFHEELPQPSVIEPISQRKEANEEHTIDS